MYRIAYIALLACFAGHSQNNSLVMNGAYLVLNGGSFNNAVQLVVNQPHANGIVRSSGHIISESQYNYVRWNSGAQPGNYIFPFGFSTSAYLPLAFNKTTNAASSITASTWATPANNLPFADSSSVSPCTNMNSIYGGTATGSVIDRWWDIAAGPATTADITFSYRGAENTTTAPTGIFGAQRWNGGQWLLPTGSAIGVASGIGTLLVPSVSAFSPFVLVNTASPLPVELISFEGNCSGKETVLTWATATETNNNYFTIERSTDNISWLAVGFVPGAGNSTHQLNYSFNDHSDLSEEIIYYRLKQTDYNSDYKYFDAVTVTNCQSDPGWMIYPNPANTLITLDFGKWPGTGFGIRLYSVEGKQLKDYWLNEQVHSKISLPVEDLANGVYFLHVTNSKNSTTKIKKLLIQH